MALMTESAVEAIEGISETTEIHGVFKGQFSLINAILACLAKTGPADLTIATWTAAEKEIEILEQLRTDGVIKSLKWLIDFSFQARKLRAVILLRARFGDNTIRVSSVHSKFITIRNSIWQLTIITSANLNKNLRLETFQIVQSDQLAAFYESVMEEFFTHQAPAEGFNMTPYEHEVYFEKHAMTPKMFEDSPFGRDLFDPAKAGFSLMDEK